MKLSLTRKNALIAFISVLLVGALSYGGWYLYNQNQEPAEQNQDKVSTIEDLEDGWKKYTNHEYGYTISYPNDWIENNGRIESPDYVNEYNERRGASIVTEVFDSITTKLKDEFDYYSKYLEEDTTDEGILKPQYSITSFKETELNYNPAIQYQGYMSHIESASDYISTLALNNNKTYITTIFFTEGNIEYENTYNNILANFEFILPSSFPSEIIYPGLILESYSEDINPDGKERIIANFISEDMSNFITRDEYKRWLEELEWESYAGGSSYSPDRGQATNIGLKKKNLDLIVTYKYPGYSEETELEKVDLQITFTD